MIEEYEEYLDKNSNNPQIMVIDALDHYSSEREQKICVARFIGELIRQDDNYYYLRHIKADLTMEDSSEEYHVVLKNCVVRKGVIELGLS